MRSRACLALLLTLWTATAAWAQGASAGGSDGPIGDGRSIGDGSGPVGDTSTRGMLSGPTRGAPVAGSSSGGMLSGSVRDATVGPAGSDQPMYGGGSVGASSRGAVKQPANLPPLRMQQPLSEDELRDLQQQLREVQPLEE